MATIPLSQKRMENISHRNSLCMILFERIPLNKAFSTTSFHIKLTNMFFPTFYKLILKWPYAIQCSNFCKKHNEEFITVICLLLNTVVSPYKAFPLCNAWVASLDGRQFSSIFTHCI